MEAFDTNSGAPPAPAGEPAAPVATNPFELDLTSPAVAAQKAAAAATVSAAGAGLLLDLSGLKDDPFQGPPFNNGHTNGNFFDFLDKSPNGKASVTNVDDEEDSGPENVDGADEKHASLLAKNPFGADIELQRQQMREFDPENEPRHDTPTPPADEVPGVISLATDNVADSEESEDEWNYYKGEPSEKPQESVVKEQQTEKEVCQEQPLKVEESDENMESQLNPNAAEFVPSPTRSMPSMEEILSKTEASEVDSFFNSTLSSVKTSDLLATQEKELDKNQDLFSTSQKEAFVNPLSTKLDVSVEESFDKGLSGALNESAALSTKAEFGDESMISGTDFQKIVDTSTNIMESTLMERDLLTSGEKISDSKLDDTTELSVVEEESNFIQDIINEFQKEPVHISFELQKEIAPQMESQPERVKVDSEDQSPTLDSEPEPELQNIIEVSENKVVDNFKFMYNDEPIEKGPALEDFMAVTNPVSQNVEDEGIVEDNTASKVEEIEIVAESPRIDEVGLLKAVESKSFVGDNHLVFSQTVEKSDLIGSAISPTVFIQSEFQEIESKVEIPSQLSESPLSELTDDLPVQQENCNKLSNEISTPEYEKLEKDLEASEQYQDQFNTPKNNIPVTSLDFTSVDENNLANVSDVLLESAHPDKVALLDDACAEPAPAEAAMVEDFAQINNGPLDVSATATLDPLSSETVPPSVLYDSAFPDNLIQTEAVPMTETVPVIKRVSEVDVLSTLSFETPQLDTTTLQSSLDVETTETASQDSAFIESQSDVIQVEDRAPAHIPSHEVVHNEISETTQAPPPTPLITQLTEGETLSFSRGTENFTEVVEKLSATRQSTEVNGLDEVNDIASETSVDVQSVLSLQAVDDVSTVVQSTAPADITEPEKMTPEPSIDTKSTDGKSLAENVVVAGGVAAAVATTAAIAVSVDKEVKKEKEVSAKKPTTVSVKDRKPCTEKPKTATKTAVSSRLTAATTKPKSPTSPVKPAVAQKTAPTRPPATSNKTVSKPPVTKTTTRPLSSVPSRTVTSTTSKPKPAGSQSPSKPAMPTVGLTKARPASSLEKKTVTNGDIKTTKRPEQLSTKTTATKLSTRPASAPTKTVSKTLSSVSTTVAKTKSPLNGPSKPKSSPPIMQVRSAAKVSNEKEIKETANKQISTRTTTSTVRSTTTTMASRTSAASAPRKIESKVVANGKGPAMKPSSMTKTTTTTTMSSRISPKKPATTTRLKATKTESLVEKSETVQGSKTVIATNE